MDYFEGIYDSVNTLPTDRLIELVSDPLNQGLEEADAAFLPLLEREPEIAMDLGIKLLVNSDGDDYMQATVWDVLIHRDPKRVIDAMRDRKELIGISTLGSILCGLEIWFPIMNIAELPKSFVELVVTSYNALLTAWHVPYSSIPAEELQAGYEEFFRRVGRE